MIKITESNLLEKPYDNRQFIIIVDDKVKKTRNLKGNMTSLENILLLDKILLAKVFIYAFLKSTLFF